MCNNIIKQHFDDITRDNIKEHNRNCQHIFGFPYRILMIAGSGFRKVNALLNLVSHQPDTDKTFLYPKDPPEEKYQLLINNRKGVDLKDCVDSKAFVKYSIYTDDIYENIEEYHPSKECKLLIVIDHMIADMLRNKKT